MTETMNPNPFPAKGKVHKQALTISAQEALAAAAAAGFHATNQGGARRVHVQRGWMTAATITPVPGGVVISPAWTLAQVIALGAVLTLIVLGVCSGMV